MFVPETLKKAQEIVVPAMHAELDRLVPEMRLVMDYHMGWRDRGGNPIQQRGSKSVRPGLALLAAAAAGGSIEAAVPGAVAVEFIHNMAFLLDDVMDGDRYRRQRETAWVVFGQGLAVCTGTALMTLAVRTVRNAESPHRDAAADLVLQTVENMFNGQAEDLSWEGRVDVSVDRCLSMTNLKTASLMRCATAVGAVLCGASPQVEQALSDYGRCLGIAFQARDDMLGIWGRPEQTGGRPVGFDLRARKNTLPTAFALQADGMHAEELRALLLRPELSDADVLRGAELVEALGGRKWTADLANRTVDEALSALDRVELSAPAKAGLAAVAEMGRPDDV